MTISNLLSINSTEITEHNRKVSISEQIAAEDIDLASGHKRRYYSRNKKEFSLNWSYLPSLQSKTVDSRVGRDFLYSLANGSSVATVRIELAPGEYETFECYIASYSEELVRREYTTQCSYYDVSLTLTER